MIIYFKFIDGGKWSTQRKPPTCRKSLTKFITRLCDKVCQWLVTCLQFSLGTPNSSTNITEILLKVALNTTNQPIYILSIKKTTELKCQFFNFYFRDISINLICITFKNNSKHPTHISMIANAFTSIFSLIQTIIEETGIASTKLSIFRDDRRVAESRIGEDTLLRELWGETMDEPDEIDLYYDYRVEFTECPILLCDYYFVDLD